MSEHAAENVAARTCGSCGDHAPYTIVLHGKRVPACLRHLNHWRTPSPLYTCPSSCAEAYHPGREHADWLAERHDRGCAAGVALSAVCTCVIPPAECGASDQHGVMRDREHLTVCPICNLNLTRLMQPATTEEMP